MDDKQDDSKYTVTALRPLTKAEKEVIGILTASEKADALLAAGREKAARLAGYSDRSGHE